MNDSLSLTDSQRVTMLGVNGENLTLIISVHTVESTLNLLTSLQQHIPYFQGKLLFCSKQVIQPEQLSCSYLQTNSSRTSILLLNDEKSMPSHWRNQALESITTDWVIFLDSQIYIQDNFIPDLYGEIYHSRASVISIPLVNRCGAFASMMSQLHLMKWKAKSINSDDKESQPIVDGYASQSFWISAISCIYRPSLIKIGGFESDVLPGLEEIHLIERVTKNNESAYLSDITCFVCDALDTNPEVGVSNLALSRLNRKRTERYYVSELGSHDVYSKQNLVHFSVKSRQKIKTALFVDVVDWAFSNIAMNLSKVKQYDLDFVVIPIHDPLSFRDSMHAALLAAADCEMIHLMWRGELYELHHQAEKIDAQKPSLHNKFLDQKILSTAIYDHAFLPHDDRIYHTLFTQLIQSRYYTANQSLFDLYSSISDFPAPQAVCTDGVDLSLFKPNPDNISKMLTKRSISIGWVGNRLWGKNDHKGLMTIIKPAVDRLIGEGYLIELKIIDRSVTWQEQHTLPQFYQSLDFYICASVHEGTPNTILEAMASGVVVLSTNVGVIPQLLGPLQKRFIFNRNPIDLYDKLKLLLEQPELWPLLRSENLEYIQNWDWSIKGRKICDFFTQAYDNHS